MPDLFREYPSNAVAGTCNNYILRFDSPVSRAGRVYYRVRSHGRLEYRFLFANTVDSTFDNGSRSRAELPGGTWSIDSLSAGDGGEHGSPDRASALSAVTFGGEPRRTVAPGEEVWSDPVSLDIPDGHYLCVRVAFTGALVPYTPDKIIPCFIDGDPEDVGPRDFPQPVLVGAKRPVSKRLAFLGDSITQGLGTRDDAYESWSARTALAQPDDVAVWNLGLGYGRAEDAALDGVWLRKAKANDACVVCYGVNDILQGRSASQVKNDLTRIVSLLRAAGVRTTILTVPPFDLEGAQRETWRDVNKYIRSVLAREADAFFDFAAVLGLDPPDDWRARYGGHPDGTGGAAASNLLLRSVSLL